MTELINLKLNEDTLPVFLGNNSCTIEKFIADNIAKVTQVYEQAGFVLFRNFSKQDREFLNRVAGLILGETMEQEGRHTVRKQVSGAIFTSTEHSKYFPIVLHSENTYLPRFPRSLFFYSELVADNGGRTPLANLQSITNAIPEPIKQKVRKEGVRYVRRIGVLPGQYWRNVYSGYSKTELTDHLEKNDTIVDWDGDVLTTTRVLPGMLQNANLKQEIWLNALYSSNSLTLPSAQRELLIREFGEEFLPSDTYFGSGERLSQSEFSILENAYNANRISFDWQVGDLLWVDNLRYAHGRDPFDGERKVFVVLGRPIEWRNLTKLPNKF